MAEEVDPVAPPPSEVDDTEDTLRQERDDGARMLGLTTCEFKVVVKAYVEGKTAPEIAAETGIEARRVYAIRTRFEERLRGAGLGEGMRQAGFAEQDIELALCVQSAWMDELPCEHDLSEQEARLTALEGQGITSLAVLQQREEAAKEMERLEHELARLRRQRVRRIARRLRCPIQTAVTQLARLLGNSAWQGLGEWRKQIEGWLIVAEDWVRFRLQSSNTSGASVEVFMLVWLQRETATIHRRLETVLGTKLTLRQAVERIRVALAEVRETCADLWWELPPGVRREYQE